MGLVRFSGWTNIISLNNINHLISLMVKWCVLFEVRAEFLTNIRRSFGFKGLLMYHVQTLQARRTLDRVEWAAIRFLEQSGSTVGVWVNPLLTQSHLYDVPFKQNPRVPCLPDGLCIIMCGKWSAMPAIYGWSVDVSGSFIPNRRGWLTVVTWT
jgi:hypothetical protein